MSEDYELGNVDLFWLEDLTTEELTTELSRAFNCLDKWVTIFQKPVSGEIREVWRETHEVLSTILSHRPKDTED